MKNYTGKNILILGGGHQQVELIKLAKEYGFKVFLSDNTDDNPGMKLADYTKKISTFSIEDNLSFAKEAGIDFVLTSGTDQPVYTAAKVSEELGLPHPINSIQGLKCTNKKHMKKALKDNNINSPNYIIVNTNDRIDDIPLNFPLVVKPVDSQGQRGISVIPNNNTYLIKRGVRNACSFSRGKEAIIEEFYAGKEITANVWLKDGIVNVLMINERLHFDDNIVLGLCKQHKYPSSGTNSLKKENEIIKIIKQISRALAIYEGPLYVQLINGDEGVKVVEFGYRVGGGFEPYFIPIMTNFDILKNYFHLVIEGENYYDGKLLNRQYSYGSINFLFCKKGMVDRIEKPGMFYGNIFVEKGTVIGEIENGTSRVGYFIVKAGSFDEYLEQIKFFDEGLRVYNKSGDDILYHGRYE